MSGHTPGPWFQRAGCPTDVESDSGHVASCETAEDACLIAAAPEMLEALQFVVDQPGAPAIGKALAAIVKATEEQS